MPLLDHFHPPLSKRRHWESFHGAWATFIAGYLNRLPLPPGYLAEPHVKVGVAVESDVGTFEERDRVSRRGNGAVGTAAWAPPKPPLVGVIDLAELEVVEVRVYDDDMARTLVAAIELVSPANKDRLMHRRAFVAKCTAYLVENVCVAIVDIVTHRRHNFHAALLEFLDAGASASQAAQSNLYAATYRMRKTPKRMRIEAWPAALTLGTSLPILPLWLSRRFALPLDLERTYRATCENLGIDL